MTSTSILRQVRDRVGFNPFVWIASVPRMKRRIAEFTAAHLPTGKGQKCLVIVTPWLDTGVPWFTLAVGLMLGARGESVTFAFDDQRFDDNSRRHRLVAWSLGRVMSGVARHFPVVRVANITPSPSDDDADAAIARLARLNATWAMRGEIVEQGRAVIEHRNADRIAAAYGRIAAFFSERHFDMMFVPGGIFGISGLWARLASARGIRVATFDTGGYETVMLAADGLACQLQDVPRAFTTIRARADTNAAERDDALAAARIEIAKRRAGSDAFESQVIGGADGGEALQGGVLIALNSSWDAAALGPHKVFDGNTEWIVETVRRLLDHSDVPVIVRQHPAERLPIAHTTDDYAALLLQHFGTHPRLHFIAAADTVNSYALLQRVRAIIVHTSTIGMEAAAFGVPVVTGSTAYYSGLGFVNRADTRAEYDALLVAAAEGRLSVDPRQRENAELCFYVTQCCNWVFSVFNPADYRRWSVLPLDRWYQEPAVQRMLEALATNTPVAVLNHEVRIAT